MIRYKKRFFLALVLFFFITADGLINAAQKSLTGWMLFRKVQSSRPKALSSTGYFPGNTSGIFYNPSLLAMVQGSEVDVFSAIGAVDEKMAGSIYCRPYKNSLSLSAGILTYDYGKVALNWIEDDQIKERMVSAQTDYLAMLAVGKPLTAKLNVGVSLKLATSRIAETASATAIVFDGGITYLPYKKLTLSLVGQNFGLSTRFIGEKDKLPRAIMAGLNYFGHFESFYLISGLEVPYLIDESRTIPSIGFELGCWPFGIFAGYRFYTREAKFSAGISITVKNYDFNYSYTPGELFDSMHRLSVGVKLDPLPDKRAAIAEKNTQAAIVRKKEFTESSNKSELLVDKFSLAPSMFLSFGTKRTELEESSGGQDLSISGGDGTGLGLTLGYGVSTKIDTDLTLSSVFSARNEEYLEAGKEFGGMPLLNLSGTGDEFRKTIILLTGKYKMPVNELTLFKVGGGFGYYSPQNLNLDFSSEGGWNAVIKYKNSLGVHFTFDVETFYYKLFSFSLGIRYNIVRYQAASLVLNGSEAPLDVQLGGGLINLNGNSIDIIGTLRF